MKKKKKIITKTYKKCIIFRVKWLKNNKYTEDNKTYKKQRNYKNLRKVKLNRLKMRIKDEDNGLPYNEKTVQNKNKNYNDKHLTKSVFTNL